MDTILLLGRTLGFSFAAGVNLYATVAVLGLASRYGWIALPEQFHIFDNDLVIGAAIVMFIVEFVADKIPWFDSLWDLVHTVVRPIGGALVAVASLGEASPELQGLIALLGGTVAASSHFTKAGTRVMVNTSPEPFSNWIVSLVEDGFAVGLGILAVQFPLVAFGVALGLLIVIACFAAVIYRAARRRLFPASPPAPIGGTAS